jgi:hypothetical protein
LLGACGNPAYAEQKFEPSTGAYSESYFTPVATARSDEGLCGPEAVLFAPHAPVLAVAKSVGVNIKTAVAYACAAVIVLSLAVPLLW